MILKRINEIQAECNVDITNENQHGFKKRRGTSTLSIQLQTILARATDANNFAFMASLDLSAAFDIVNIKLLIKRLTIVVLPGYVISLIIFYIITMH